LTPPDEDISGARVSSPKPQSSTGAAASAAGAAGAGAEAPPDWPRFKMMLTPSFSTSAAKLASTRKLTTSLMLAWRNSTAGMMMVFILSCRRCEAGLLSTPPGWPASSGISIAVRMGGLQLRRTSVIMPCTRASRS